MKIIEKVLNHEKDTKMTVYLNLESPEFHHGKRPLIVVLPGGGYSFCSDRESELVALQYMAAGYQACVLHYTLKDKGSWPDPLNDYEQTIEMIAAHSDEWNIDMGHIAVVGFSAGGHLAACTATLAKRKPQAVICVYPAILPDIVDMCQTGMPYPNEHVDGNTSPCYIVAGRDDGLVNVNNAMVFAQALEKAGVTFDLHIYSRGQHGFSIGTPLILDGEATPRLAQWVPDSIVWLGEIMGVFTDTGFKEPTIRPSLNADAEPRLSVECSLRHILRQNEETQNIMRPVYEKIRAMAEARNFSYEGLCAAISSYTVKEILGVFKTAPDEILRLNEALQQIPNI